jgi:hypothetical protein
MIKGPCGNNSKTGAYDYSGSPTTLFVRHTAHPHATPRATNTRRRHCVLLVLLLLLHFDRGMPAPRHLLLGCSHTRCTERNRRGAHGSFSGVSPAQQRTRWGSRRPQMQMQWPRCGRQVLQCFTYERRTDCERRRRSRHPLAQSNATLQYHKCMHNRHDEVQASKRVLASNAQRALQQRAQQGPPLGTTRDLRAMRKQQNPHCSTLRHHPLVDSLNAICDATLRVHEGGNRSVQIGMERRHSRRV